MRASRIARLLCLQVPSAHLIVLDLVLEPDLGLEVLEELVVVVQVQEGQEGRLDLVPGLVLEVPVVVEVQEVQQAQQELETDVLFEL